MKEINIAQTIIRKRKEKNITQDTLASYIGVSKASVSKWETGQSYPDITFLPQLAAYFNISIDDLMGYEPQMTMEGVRKLYLELSNDFAEKPFGEVVRRCQETAKKYFSCFPLLLYMGTLFINYNRLAEDKAQSECMLREAKAWFIRVKEQSGDMELAKKALHVEALCAHILGNPNEVIELLSEVSAHQIASEPVLAAAYQMTGKTQEAKTVLQIGIYQHVMALFGIFPAYLSLYAGDALRFEQALQRITSTAEIFGMKQLHPVVLLNLYLAASQGHLANGDADKALDMLEKYAQIAAQDIYPLKLHGDDFFDLLDGWLEELFLGVEAPRNEKIIRQDVADAVANHPAYAGLAEERRFQNVVEILEQMKKI